MRIQTKKNKKSNKAWIFLAKKVKKCTYFFFILNCLKPDDGGSPHPKKGVIYFIFFNCFVHVKHFKMKSPSAQDGKKNESFFFFMCLLLIRMEMEKVKTWKQTSAFSPCPCSNLISVFPPLLIVHRHIWQVNIMVLARVVVITISTAKKRSIMLAMGTSPAVQAYEQMRYTPQGGAISPLFSPH